MTNGITFDVQLFLSTEGPGRRISSIRPKGVIFVQGAASSSVYFLQHGRAKLTVVSHSGKEATITLLVPGEFIGEEALCNPTPPRLATASAITECMVLKIDRSEMLKAIREEHLLADVFLKFLLVRGMRTQADLVDQLFNSSEKRLARALLLMAEFDRPGQVESIIPEITQESLAEIVGTTRSRVSFFMNRFRRLGLIEYNGRIHVNKALLNVFLNDRLPGENASRPSIQGEGKASS